MMIEDVVLEVALLEGEGGDRIVAGQDLVLGHIHEEGVVAQHLKDLDLCPIPDLAHMDVASQLGIVLVNTTVLRVTVAVSLTKRAEATLLSISRVFDVLRVYPEIL